MAEQPYDAAAQVYAEMFRDSLAGSPVDRAVLGLFAELTAGGPVADVGCGPGHVTAHLAGLGVPVFGVDVSAAMVTLARREHPRLGFARASMAALPVASGALRGVLARWSIIHTPPPEVPALLAECARVVLPGGHLLLGFSATNGPRQVTQAFDHTVTTAWRWWPDHLAGLLRDAGMAEVCRMVAEPGPADRRPFRQVHLLARKA